jgi:2-keto-4-pentenoate hydratase/2-oxohepta-3-ene-1,7-dioic acid hydratase in catechol pathway
MRICRFDDRRLGVVEGDLVADVSAATDALPPLAWPVPHGDHLLRNLAAVRERIDALLPDAPRTPLAEVALLSPVANPSKVIAAPLNYRLHTQEVGTDPGIHHKTHASTFDGYKTPIEKLGLFLKASTSVVGPGEGVTLSQRERRNDHEVELVVVIGQEARDLTRENALDVVAGYCIGLDMTVRGPEDRSMRKSSDSYTVLGPWMVTAEEIADPDRLDLELTIGGETRQRSSTADLTVDVRDLIALASQWYTLYPGDVLMTGTPDGVGPVLPGETMVAELEDVGEMRVAVR